MPVASRMTSSLKSLAAAHADLSWVRMLIPDPTASTHVPNKTSRQVTSGHYVPVRPTPLPHPILIHVSSSLLSDLHMNVQTTLNDSNFVAHMTGDVTVPQEINGWGTTWATPYALSIYGQEMYNNCPFKNGNGYGDGRAISVGELCSKNVVLVSTMKYLY